MINSIRYDYEKNITITIFHILEAEWKLEHNIEQFEQNYQTDLGMINIELLTEQNDQ